MATRDQDITASDNSGTAQSGREGGSDQIQLAQALPAAASTGQNVVNITPPPAGQRVEIKVEAGQTIIFVDNCNSLIAPEVIPIALVRAAVTQIVYMCFRLSNAATLPLVFVSFSAK